MRQFFSFHHKCTPFDLNVLFSNTKGIFAIVFLRICIEQIPNFKLQRPVWIYYGSLLQHYKALAKTTTESTLSQECSRPQNFAKSTVFDSLMRFRIRGLINRISGKTWETFAFKFMPVPLIRKVCICELTAFLLF